MINDGTNPLPNATISINGQTLTTDNNGKATIVLPIGSYPYTVKAACYVSVMNTATITNANITVSEILYHVPYNVTFTVTAGGNALANTNIAIGSQTITTNALGIATVSLLNGSYQWLAYTTGYNNQSGTVTVSCADANVSIAMVLTTYTITFDISDGTNKIPNATININGQTLTTDNNGKATIILPPGNYPYTITKDCYNAISNTASVKNANLTIPGVLIQTPYTITFTVISNGVVLPNANIQINNQSLTTNSSGIATINLTNANYSWTATKS